MLFDASGNLYLSAMQQNAVIQVSPNGNQERIVQAEQLKWPDIFALGADNQAYVTSFHLHIPRRERTVPYQLFKFALP